MRRSSHALILGAVFVSLLATAPIHAQGVAINATGAAADTSAILDLGSTSKGLLPPRMNSLQREGIVLPATGLVVYQTDGVAGLYYNAGTPATPNWKQLADAGGGSGQWSTSGGNLFYSAGQVAIGTNTFGAGLTVSDAVNGLRVATTLAGGAVASFGGVGNFRVDAPFIVAGRLQLLENGFLGLGRTVPVSRLDIAGGAGDLVATEGDLRIGDATTRLKFGISTSGSIGAATIMEQGPVGQYNVLALGSQGNKVLYVNGNSQRVGIGTDTPNAPLAFPPVLGKKITLYPGATGDVGIGVAGNRLQLYSDNPSADVAIGYDQAGTFTERFAVKPTGALAVNANVGTAGQVLQSNGAGSPATWVSATNAAFNNAYVTTHTVAQSLPADGADYALSNLAQSFSVATNSKLIISWNVETSTTTCFACGASDFRISVWVDGARLQVNGYECANGRYRACAGTYFATVGPGAHTVSLTGATTGPNLTVEGPALQPSQLILQVMQQ